MNKLQEFFKELEMKGMERQKDVIDILKTDHRKVQLMMDRFEKTEAAAEKRQLKEKIIEELSIHATVEEEMVYPLIATQDQFDAATAVEEHSVVKRLLAELAEVTAASQDAAVKMKVLCELVKHHIKEEESTLLPMLKKSGQDLEVLGEEVMERKESLKGMPVMKKPLQQLGRKKASQKMRKAS